MKKTLVRNWIENFNNGDYESKDFETQVEAGWYDWFCSINALSGRLKKMGNIIKDIKNDYLLDNYKIWFKNNCPCEYPLYDDFRFEPLDEAKRNKLYFGVSCGHPFGSEYMYEIFTARNDYRTEFKCKNKKELLKTIEQLMVEFQQI